MLKDELAKTIDHTILQSTASQSELEQLCSEAIKFGFYAVCVNPCYLKKAKELLHGSGVKLCTVIGFPLGANDLETKVFESQLAVENGADEIDFVVNLGFIKSGLWKQVSKEIEQITQKAKTKGLELNKDIIVKVIVETCYLTDQEKSKLCQLVKLRGADYIKTSTGFGIGGAEIEDIKLFRKIGGESLKIKASGGIRTAAKVQEMIAAGADRIGTSSGVAILKEIE